jgi:hypothetical protein
MGVDLIGRGNGEARFHLGHYAWADLRELADAFGWEPMGTRLGAPFEEWTCHLSSYVGPLVLKR